MTQSGAGCNTTRDLFLERGSAHVDALREFKTPNAMSLSRYLPAAMSDVPAGSPDQQLSSMENNYEHRRNVKKGSSPGKGSSGSRSGSFQRETNQGVRKHTRGHDHGSGDKPATPQTLSVPSSSPDTRTSVRT